MYPKRTLPFQYVLCGVQSKTDHAFAEIECLGMSTARVGYELTITCSKCGLTVVKDQESFIEEQSWYQRPLVRGLTNDAIERYQQRIARRST